MTTALDLGPQLCVLVQLRSFSSQQVSAPASELGGAPRRAVGQIAPLSFGPPPDELGCSEGELARMLHRRTKDGCASPQEALGMWLSREQALRFDEDVRSGRLVQWVKLQPAEIEVPVGLALLKSGPLRVVVTDLVPVVG